MTGIRLRHVLTIGTAVLCLAIRPAQAQELTDTQQQLWAMEEAYWAAIGTKDLETLMGFFTEGAVTWPADSGQVATPGELRADLEALFADTEEEYLTCELAPGPIQVDGKVAMVFYSVKGKIAFTDGNRRFFEDRFVHVWKRSRGSWRIVGAMGAPLPREKVEDPRKALEDARWLAREGRYAEALAKHIWFHDHALEYAPALAGVRLSFALSDWVKLGDHYPAALDALAAIRNDNTLAIEQGNGTFGLFCDVAAINERFGEGESTYELFLLVHGKYPELAHQCFYVAREQLIEHRDYELALVYIPDFRTDFQQLSRRWEMTRDRANRDPEKPDGLLETLADQRFRGGVADLVEVFAGTGRDEDVEAIVEMALGVMDTDAMKEAIDRALARAAE